MQIKLHCLASQRKRLWLASFILRADHDKRRAFGLERMQTRPSVARTRQWAKYVDNTVLMPVG